MSNEPNLIIGALDSLAMALINHGHTWTDGERTIYEQAIQSALDQACAEKDREIARLKRGEFTPEEFQNLCHEREDRPGCSVRQFFDGCADYQLKLFGLSDRMAKDQRIAELEAQNQELRGHMADIIRPALDQIRTADYVKRIDELERLIVIESESYRRSVQEALRLEALLKRVPHHGPSGSWNNAQGTCWKDCVACEFEKLPKM